MRGGVGGESNPSDERLNRCVVETLRGTKHRAPGVRPGRFFRVQWGSKKMGNPWLRLACIIAATALGAPRA